MSGRPKNRLEEWMYNNSWWFWVLFFGLLLVMTFFATGCSSTQQIEERIVVQRQTDTIYSHSTDTVVSTIVVHDSVERIVRDSAWVDSIGVRHHYRLVMMNKSVRESNAKYEAKEAECARLSHQVDSLSAMEQKAIVREIKIYPAWSHIVAFLAGIAVVIVLIAAWRELQRSIARSIDNNNSEEEHI